MASAAGVQAWQVKVRPARNSRTGLGDFSPCYEPYNHIHRCGVAVGWQKNRQNLPAYLGLGLAIWATPIMPTATRAPALPVGWVLKSSSPA